MTSSKRSGGRETLVDPESVKVPEVQRYLAEVRRLNKELDGPVHPNRGVRVANIGRAPVQVYAGTESVVLKTHEERVFCASQLEAPRTPLGRGLPTFASRFLHVVIENTARQRASVQVDSTEVDPRSPGGLTVLTEIQEANGWNVAELAEPKNFEIAPSSNLIVVGIGFSLRPELVPGLAPRL
jgi:hypothetical protein